ncbi:MAG: class II aldolase/adducin family protein, partial [Methanocorpusculum sp.]|nr:class II aldolase/adducin family protein [Methanocorpusculum sp.]
VLHTHPVYANFATCCADCEMVVQMALAGADYTYGIVPYADPGSKLTFFVRDEMMRSERESGKLPKVLFMKNHGLIVHGSRMT